MYKATKKLDAIHKSNRALHGNLYVPLKDSKCISLFSCQKSLAIAACKVVQSESLQKRAHYLDFAKRSCLEYPLTEVVKLDHASFFAAILEEHEYWIETDWVEGEIPPELTGTYLRNGPGLQAENRHLFDGDGMIVSVAFSGGRAYFRNKYVRTRGFVDEQAAGRALYRNSFTRGAVDGGSVFNPLDLKFKNIANTSVLHWAGKLLALWEMGLPHELDPSTLDTLGETTLGGQIKGGRLAGHYRMIGRSSAHSPGASGSSAVAFKSANEELERQCVLGDRQSGGDTDIGIVDGTVPSSISRSDLPIMSSEKPAKELFCTTLDLHDESVRLLLGGSVKMGSLHSSPQMLLHDRPKSRTERKLRNESSSWVGGIPSSPEESSKLNECNSLSEAVLRKDDALMVAFTNGVGFGGFNVTFYEFNRQGVAENTTTFPLQGIDITFIHDLLVTPSWYILLLGPVNFDLSTFLTKYCLSKCSIAECLSFNRQGSTKVLLFPRPGSGIKESRVLHTSPFFAFHHVNAYQVEEGRKLVLDTLAWNKLVFNVDEFRGQGSSSPGEDAACQYTRLVVDLQSGSVMPQTLAPRIMEFPTINMAYTGKEHRYSYVLCDVSDVEESEGAPGVRPGAMQALAKVSTPIGICSTPAATTLETWAPGPRCYPAEPCFVARPNGSGTEDEGWVLSLVFNAATGKSYVAILDAQHFSDGPVARLNLPHAVPCGFHGSFTTEYLGPDPESAQCDFNALTSERWRKASKAVRAIT